jgi:hypothetical protein
MDSDIFFFNIQSSSEAQSAYYPKTPAVLSQEISGKNVRLTTNFI